jgi:hypothetical protein
MPLAGLSLEACKLILRYPDRQKRAGLHSPNSLKPVMATAELNAL